MEDLGRCEFCGKYVPEIELESVEITDTKINKTQELLWCPDCYAVIEQVMDTTQGYTKRSRPIRK
jgi:hypothetical protein